MPTFSAATAMGTERPTAVVLGASVGVGAAIAERLWVDGYRVLGFYRGQHPRLDSSAVELFVHDAGKSRESVHGCINELWRAQVREVNVLVHSLSGASVGSALTMPTALIEKSFNNLAHSFLWWAQELLNAGLLAADARLLALSNPCAYFPLAQGGVIGAAKAALEGYVRSLAIELGPGGTRVNALQFGTVLTPAVQRLLKTDRMAKLHAQIIPAGRLQTATDVANFVSLLMRPEAAWINGAVLDATGGMLLTLLDYAYSSAKN